MDGSAGDRFAIKDPPFGWAVGSAVLLFALANFYRGQHAHPSTSGMALDIVFIAVGSGLFLPKFNRRPERLAVDARGLACRGTYAGGRPFTVPWDRVEAIHCGPTARSRGQLRIVVAAEALDPSTAGMRARERAALESLSPGRVHLKPAYALLEFDIGFRAIEAAYDSLRSLAPAGIPVTKALAAVPIDSWLPNRVRK